MILPFVQKQLEVEVRGGGRVVLVLSRTRDDEELEETAALLYCSVDLQSVNVESIQSYSDI